MPRADALVKSHSWWIRLTAPHEHLLKCYREGIKDRIDFSGALLATHSGDSEEPNPHVHIALILKSYIQKQAVLDRLKKLTGCVANQIYVKPWDMDDQVLRYCYHEQVDGKPSTVINDIGLTEEKIVRLKAESKILNEEVAAQNERASHKVVNYVLDLIQASGTKFTKEKVAWEIIKGVWKQQFHDPGDVALEKHINEILIKQCDDEESLKSYFHDRVSRMWMFKR